MDLDDDKRCHNCDHEVSGPFCPACGQSTRSLKISFWILLTDFLGDYFTFDSKLTRTLIPLLKKPGFLTLEFIDGRRVRYVPPLRLYVFLSIIFFVSMGSSGDAEEEKEVNRDPQALNALKIDPEKSFSSVQELDWMKITHWAMEGQPEAELAEEHPEMRQPKRLTRLLKDEEKPFESFQDLDMEKVRKRAVSEKENRGFTVDEDGFDDGTMLGLGGYLNRIIERGNKRLGELTPEQSKKVFIREILNAIPKVMFLLLPLVALLLKLLYIRRDPLYLDHLIFAFHLHAAYYLVFSILIWLSALFDSGWLIVFNVIIILLGSPLYCVLALLRVYQQGVIKTLLKFLVFFFTYFIMLSFGLLLALFVAMASI